MFVGWKAKEFLWLLLLPTPAMFVVIRFLHPQLRIAERLILDRAGKLHSYLISVLESARTIHSSRAQGLVLGLADTHLRRLVDATCVGRLSEHRSVLPQAWCRALVKSLSCWWEQSM